LSYDTNETAACQRKTDFVQAECTDWAKSRLIRAEERSSDRPSRLDDLRRTKACVKFLSLEPLLGPLEKLNLRGIDWAIVGGESGPGARPVDAAWVADIRDQCVRAGVAFFFKQWGGVQKKKTGRELEGRTWDEMPQLAVLS
jgi:protein gp37